MAVPDRLDNDAYAARAAEVAAQQVRRDAARRVTRTALSTNATRMQNVFRQKAPKFAALQPSLMRLQTALINSPVSAVNDQFNLLEEKINTLLQDDRQLLEPFRTNIRGSIAYWQLLDAQ